MTGSKRARFPAHLQRVLLASHVAELVGHQPSPVRDPPHPISIRNDGRIGLQFANVRTQCHRSTPRRSTLAPISTGKPGGKPVEERVRLLDHRDRQKLARELLLLLIRVRIVRLELGARPGSLHSR